MTWIVIQLGLLIAAAIPAAAEVATVRVRGNRYVAGVEERISCAAHAGSPNRWRRDGVGLRRFDLDPSCPLAADLAGAVFSGGEDTIVVSGFDTRRAIVVATSGGPLRGTVTGELRRLFDGTFTYERGRIAYQLGDVTFVGDYKVRCDPSADVCAP